MRRIGIALPMWFAYAAIASTPAYAQKPPGSGGNRTQAQTTAEQLFEQARRLLAEEKVDDACPRFAESHRLDPAGGTILNLALCHEQQGRTATAWAEFKEAVDWATRDHRENRERIAREHIAALTPRLAHMAIKPGATVPGLEIRLDGLVLGEASWGEGIAVDPGEHRVDAVAPRHEPWTKSVTVDPARVERSADALVVVEIPSLTPKAVDPATLALPAPAAREPQPASMSAGRKTGVFVSFGVAAVGVGVGAVFGLLTVSKRSESNQLCPRGDGSCSSKGVALNDQAITYSWVSTAGFGGAVVASVVGTVLLLSAESPRKRAAARIAPFVDAATRGLLLERAF